ncbi:MAG: hypothetical protein IPL33_10065 [Sphingobacteriales bacterium]|nr:hypothetical protein [Sphingobacteriales bacterium]
MIVNVTVPFCAVVEGVRLSVVPLPEPAGLLYDTEKLGQLTVTDAEQVPLTPVATILGYTVTPSGPKTLLLQLPIVVASNEAV